MDSIYAKMSIISKYTQRKNTHIHEAHTSVGFKCKIGTSVQIQGVHKIREGWSLNGNQE